MALAANAAPAAPGGFGMGGGGANFRQQNGFADGEMTAASQGRRSRRSRRAIRARAPSPPSARTSPTPPTGPPPSPRTRTASAEFSFNAARSAHGLENPRLGHGARHARRPGRSRGRHQEGFDRPLQAPRFFVQKDEAVLSANVHNYLKSEKKIRVSLEMDGGTLAALDPLTREITVASGGEAARRLARESRQRRGSGRSASRRSPTKIRTPCRCASPCSSTACSRWIPSPASFGPTRARGRSSSTCRPSGASMTACWKSAIRRPWPAR